MLHTAWGVVRVRVFRERGGAGRGAGARRRLGVCQEPTQRTGVFRMASQSDSPVTRKDGTIHHHQGDRADELRRGGWVILAGAALE